MASGVSSFIKQSIKFEDICSDEEDTRPIQATPISKFPPPSTSNQAPNFSKKKLPNITSDSARASDSRPSKKPKALFTHEEGSFVTFHLFTQMIKNQIPEETIAQWDKVKMVGTASTVTLRMLRAYSSILNTVSKSWKLLGRTRD